MAKQHNKKNSAKASRERALNAFDTAADDDFYIKGLRQQQDIDLEHISDDRIRELLSNVVNSEDDEEIDSDEAMGSGSEISLGEPNSGDEDEWGESLDEAELLPLSEVWDLNNDGDTSVNKKTHTKDKSELHQSTTESGQYSDMENSDGDSESDSESDNDSSGSSGSDAFTGSSSESDGDGDDESEESDEESNAALRQAIKSVGNHKTGLDNVVLADAANENPFALPVNDDAALSINDIVPEAQAGKALSVPAPKRVQDRADRSAAYQLAKGEVNKWTETVQANRQAEHLQFPINAPPQMETSSPFTPSERTSSLEDKVNTILQSSSLMDENAASTFEEMAPSKLSIEELRERRKQLRYMRDLMFREEQRAKRIKKIKSKAYRKIHKKERQKMAELAGEDGSEEGESHSDIERAERDRALERATLRHKAGNSKWAKGLLDHGLTRDANTRAELEEMLRQSDSLRQKVRGNEVEEEEASDYDAAELDIDSEHENESDSAVKQKGVLGMKFMKEAEKRHREENRRMLRDDYDSDDENSNIGRKSFNPAGQQLKRELEEQSDASDNEEEGVHAINKKIKPNKDGSKQKTRAERGDETVEFVRQVPESRGGTSVTKPVPNNSSVDATTDISENPWLAASARASVPGTIKLSAPSKSTGKSSKIVVENTFGDSLVREKDLSLQQQELVRQAFAGDDVAADFEAAKQAEIEEDGDKEIDETLPGWGTWSNEKPRMKKVRHVTGINEKKRQDYKKANVIINEKVNKKSSKYNASAVPFPFENRQQYERSLRMPIGQEWVSKDTFQRQTKPRVLVKRGAVIDPIKRTTK